MEITSTKVNTRKRDRKKIFSIQRGRKIRSKIRRRFRELLAFSFILFALFSLFDGFLFPPPPYPVLTLILFACSFFSLFSFLFFALQSRSFSRLLLFYVVARTRCVGKISFSRGRLPTISSSLKWASKWTGLRWLSLECDAPYLQIAHSPSHVRSGIFFARLDLRLRTR